MGLINYQGDSKLLKRICQLLKVTDVQDSEGHSLVGDDGIAVVQGGGGSSTLAGLSDVDTTGASAGDVLAYNGTSQKWEGLTLTIPTKTSDLNNDSGFITNTVNNLTNYYLKSETYTKAEVNTLIGQISTISILVVQSLPTQDIQTNIIYLVPKQTAGTQDVYDEYIYVNNAWELIGDTEVDLSNYYTKSQVDALIPDELADLTDDSTHRLVTDTEKTAWSAKVDDNPTFSEASTRANIDSGDSFATILGKIKKFFTDLKTVAFTGSYSDLSDQPTIPSVSANPSTTTAILSGIEIDGTAYAVQGGGGVTGVKGDSESTYRTGNVNITPANVGAVSKSGDTVNGCLIVQNTGSNFDEGVRINKNSSDLSGYVSFVLGSAKDSATGIQDGAWWIGLPPIANGRKLFITHNGSTQGETYFEADSANRKSPALHLGWSGNVADGNAYAVTGDVVYDYITSHMLNARPDASGNMNDAASFGNSMGMIYLSGTDETVNPNGKTGWHHFINMSYSQTSGSNMRQTQLACMAGTSDIFVRSRSGGSVTAGTAWAAPWVRLLKGILRVSKSCNWMPGKNGVYFEEYTAGSNYNLPSNHYYHIVSMQGPDTNYGTQLALGMTTEGAYYRCYNNKSWGSWRSLIDTNTNDAVTQTNTLAITTENKWYRLLYSGTADDITRTEGARKGIISFNPMARAIAFANTNSYLLSCQTNKSLVMYNDGDGNHGLCHRAVNGDDNQWGLMPYKDGWLGLGHGSYRWGQIYSTNAAISTSDRNEKKDISPLDDKAKDFIMALNPVSYKFIDGKTGRTHYGMIAQDVEEEMSSLGMTDMDFAGFCKDQKMEENYIENEDGTKTPDFKYIDEYRYGLRYEEFIAPLIKTVQIQQEEIEMLKKRLEALEGEK